MPLQAVDERSEAIRVLHAKYGHQVSGTVESFHHSAYIVVANPTNNSSDGDQP